MQQDKSVVFGGRMKIHLMVFHVSRRVVLIRNISIGEREKTGVRRRRGKRGWREKCGG